jgi:hypothetical protein
VKTIVWGGSLNYVVIGLQLFQASPSSVKDLKEDRLTFTYFLEVHINSGYTLLSMRHAELCVVTGLGHKQGNKYWGRVHAENDAE